MGCQHCWANGFLAACHIWQINMLAWLSSNSQQSTSILSVRYHYAPRTCWSPAYMYMYIASNSINSLIGRVCRTLIGSRQGSKLSSGSLIRLIDSRFIVGLLLLLLAAVQYNVRAARLSISLLSLRPFYIATQLNSTRRRVELSCVAISGPLQNKSQVSIWRLHFY